MCMRTLRPTMQHTISVKTQWLPGYTRNEYCHATVNYKMEHQTTNCTYHSSFTLENQQKYCHPQNISLLALSEVNKRNSSTKYAAHINWRSTSPLPVSVLVSNLECFWVPPGLGKNFVATSSLVTYSPSGLPNLLYLFQTHKLTNFKIIINAKFKFV